MTFLIEACFIEDDRVDSLVKPRERTARQAPQKSRSYQIETSCLALSIVSLTPILVRASPLSRWISTVTSGRFSGKKALLATVVTPVLFAWWTFAVCNVVNDGDSFIHTRSVEIRGKRPVRYDLWIQFYSRCRPVYTHQSSVFFYSVISKCAFFPIVTETRIS